MTFGWWEELRTGILRLHFWSLFMILTMAHDPNLSSLFVINKVLWNTVLSICLYIVNSCVYATKAGVQQRAYCLWKMFTLWSSIYNLPILVLQHKNYSWATSRWFSGDELESGEKYYLSFLYWNFHKIFLCLLSNKDKNWPSWIGCRSWLGQA